MERLNEYSGKIIGAAVEVHRHLGPALLESAYEECLNYELGKYGLLVRRQVPVPALYKEVELEYGYRIDILIEDLIIVELKSIDVLLPIHEAQILTYMKFSQKKLGLLINFNVTLLKNGLRRFIM
ncbi:MAG: GxxExxY protein [Bacteroidota bacterium]